MNPAAAKWEALTKPLEGLLGRIRDSERVRGEIGWVVFHWAAEFALVFAVLKLLTTILGREGYGEYTLVVTATDLVGAVLLSPVIQAFLRTYHPAERDQHERRAGLLVFRWYAAASIGVMTAGALLSKPFAAQFNLHPWSVLVGGLIFTGYQFRMLGVEVLTIRRRRRATALLNCAFLATQILLLLLITSIWGATAQGALTSYALAVLLFAAVIAIPLLCELLGKPDNGAFNLRPLIWSFGVPAGLLLVLQWFQSCGDRYILDRLVDREAVGCYVAANQVGSAPYFLLYGVLATLLRPIAYQRCNDCNDARGLWAADRLLLGGIGAYVVLGGLAGVGFALCGPELLVLFSSEQFALPRITFVVLAVSRGLQRLGFLLELFFAVHQRMSALLAFRIAGATFTLAICWVMTAGWGLPGAALGSLTAAALNVGLIVLGPGGVLHMIRAARRSLRAQVSEPRGVPAASVARVEGLVQTRDLGDAK
ncbi:MAG: hypothetical protein KBH81_09105 [Phycisphaerae bacterium]|jgi:O-antigen/teichoic acid export membrane protein|nr:hypothetical protein [Phycisphaerae bacterium]